jgi:hypothetical protein
MDMRASPTAPTSRGVVPSDSRMTRPLLIGGVVGPVLFVVVLLIEGATRPGYSAWRNFVSQLSLSSQGWEQVTNFLVCGLLCLGFSAGLRRALAGGKGAVAGPAALGVFGAGLIIAGVFSTDPALGYPPGTLPVSGSPALHGTPHAMIHGLAGLVCFVSLTVACFAMARRFGGDIRWRGWTAYSILTGIVVLSGFVASNTTSVLDMRGVWPNAPTGLIQRVAIISGWVWVALLAGRLLRDMRPGEARQS